MANQDTLSRMVRPYSIKRKYQTPTTLVVLRQLTWPIPWFNFKAYFFTVTLSFYLHCQRLTDP